jgi:hypothetical protein
VTSRRHIEQTVTRSPRTDPATASQGPSRKSSHDAEREAERPFVMTILTVVATCRWQGREVVEGMTKWSLAPLQGARRNPLESPQTH